MKKLETSHFRSKSGSSRDIEKPNIKSGVGSRRGGYGDGGGVTDDGSLPKAKASRIKSDAELNSELNRTLGQLDPKKDWNIRVSALVTLEGLILGGALQSSCFQNHQRLLREMLVVQINDRRSAVSRQACQFIETMAQEMGSKFEGFAQYFYPVLVKLLAITVQVIAESADNCLKTIFSACHSHKIVSKLCESTSNDKNGKIRLHCSKYLQLIINQWDLRNYEKHLDSVEKALASCMTDQLPDTRDTGRNSFIKYSEICPERASQLFAKFDTSTKEKLQNQNYQYQPVESHQNFSGQSFRGANDGGNYQLNNQFKMPPPRERPSTAPSGGQRNQKSSNSNSSQNLYGEENVHFGRVNNSNEIQQSSGFRNSNNQNLYSNYNPSYLQPTEMQVDSESLQSTEDLHASSLNQGTLSKFLLPVNPHEWSELVSKMESIEHYLITTEKQMLQFDLDINGKKLVKFLKDGLEHHHFKVVQVSLQTLCTLIDLEPKLCEQQLINFYQILFLKATDAREQIREAAMATIEKCGQKCSNEVIFPAIIKTAGNLKVPKAQSIFFKHMVGLIDQHFLTVDSQQSIGYLKQLIKIVAKITMNKNAEVRDGAISAIKTIYLNLGQKFVFETIYRMGSETQKILQSMKNQISTIESDYASFLRVKTKGEQWQPENNNHNLQQNEQKLLQKTIQKQQQNLILQQQQIDQNNHLIMQESTKQNIENMEIDDEEVPIETKITLFQTNENNINLNNNKNNNKISNRQRFSDEQLKQLLYKLIQNPTLDELLMVGSYVNEIHSPELTELTMHALIKLFDNPDTQLQDNAILTLKSLAPYQPQLVDKFAEEIIQKLIYRCEISTRLVSLSADTTLAHLTQILPKQKFMGILLQQLLKNNLDSQFQVHVIRNMGRISQGMQKDELMNILQQSLLSVLLQLLQSEHVGVRKAVVYCLVDVWEVVGQDLFPFLSGLSPAQQNLIQAYINRKAENVQQIANGNC